MFVYPEINPVAFSIGPVYVHWYGLMYLFAFIAAYGGAHWRIKHYQLCWTDTEVSDLIFFAALGVVIGGRLGYMVFYNFQAMCRMPWIVLKVWEGGMSFHGGLIGVIMAMVYAAHVMKRPFLDIADFVVPLVPMGLAAGRLGNFINGELWGRVTDVPWAIIFPSVDHLPRHPSQLYELGLEGVGLFVLIWIYAAKPRPRGAVSGIFLMGYAVFRLFVECFRQPDQQLGFVAFHHITMGQLLSIPLLLGGIVLFFTSIQRHDANLS